MSSGLGTSGQILQPGVEAAGVGVGWEWAGQRDLSRETRNPSC